jgi:hypothetical protein
MANAAAPTPEIAGLIVSYRAGTPEARDARLAARQLGEPSFPEAPWLRDRPKMIASLKEANTRPATLAGRAFNQAVYGNHPYGRETTEAIPRSRRYVNDTVGRIRQLFNWAVGLELIPPERAYALSRIRALPMGQGRETDRRTEVTAALDGALLDLYERQRKASGIGAGRLLGHRCGACRIELDRGEVARISAAAEDEVLRCSECRAILLRVDRIGVID